MMTKEEMLPLLLKACPSFEDTFESLREIRGKIDIELSLDDFGDHVFALYSQNETNESTTISNAIEKLKSEGDDEVKKLLDICFFCVLDEHLRKMNRKN
jgi:hypothetical protein